MMKKEALEFFSIGQQIFGICPHSGEFFRLSDCKVYQKKRPPKDWFENERLEEKRLDHYKLKTDEMRLPLQLRAIEKGRLAAKLAVKKLDPVFASLKLDPDDAKVIFHPIDYIVFNGMKNGSSRMKNITLLDRVAVSSEHRQIQKSIAAVVAKKKYEWQTLSIDEKGSIMAKK